MGFIVLLALAFMLFLTPSYIIYATCQKFDDHIPSFIKALKNMPYYIKKYRRIQRDSYNRKYTSCFMWYITTAFSIILVLVAVFLKM